MRSITLANNALFLAIILSVSCLGDQIGSFSFSTPGFGEIDISSYNDQGGLVSTVTETSGGAPCETTCLTNTFYVDPTALANALKQLPGSYNLVAENFASPTVISSISDTLINSACEFQPCGTAPTNSLPLTVTPTSVTGTVGNCGGPPHCTTNGYSYAYALDIKFNQPVYAIYGTFGQGGYFVPTLGPTVPTGGGYTYLGDLPFSDGYFFPYEYLNDGWIFPNGTTEIILGAFGGVPGRDLLNGTAQFTMSNVELGISSAPEPTGLGLASLGLLGLLCITSKARRTDGHV